MKRILFILTLFLAINLRAAPFWSSSNPNFNAFTNTVVLTFTNSQTVTNILGSKESVNHTFHLFATTSGTNAITANLDRTIDGANWIPCSTNTISTNGFAEVTATGKWAQFRWRLTSSTTNATVIENYMSQ